MVASRGEAGCDSNHLKLTIRLSVILPNRTVVVTRDPILMRRIGYFNWYAFIFMHLFCAISSRRKLLH